MYECVFPRTGVVVNRFKPPLGSIARKEFKVGCGQCSGCRSKATRNWAIRMYHESLLHKFNCFITLTVNNKNLETVFPKGSVRYEPFQLFIRALRKKLRPLEIRFFMCAEYGENFQRPHFHAILFGWFPKTSDLTLVKETQAGKLWSSFLISDVWKFGFNTVANFDFACAQYVAGYVTKKINGKMKKDWYQGRNPEFGKMSLKHGIGSNFYKKYTSDLFRRDKVEMPGGIELPMPRYYDKLHEFYHPAHMDKVKAIRAVPDPIREADNTPERLAVRKVCHEARLKLKSRSFEKGN